jgi:hypothetical protein
MARGYSSASSEANKTPREIWMENPNDKGARAVQARRDYPNEEARNAAFASAKADTQAIIKTTLDAVKEFKADKSDKAWVKAYKIALALDQWESSGKYQNPLYSVDTRNALGLASRNFGRASRLMEILQQGEKAISKENDAIVESLEQYTDKTMAREVKARLKEAESYLKKAVKALENE